jgi:glucose uptake protein GlcU
VPRFFLFSAFGATARSKSGVAVAVSFRQNFILSTIGGVLLKANMTFDVVIPRLC